jgi:O-acetylhomoserine/O-acetylserine sulfhydrylase-like pyridoxal-dependent enzyme
LWESLFTRFCAALTTAGSSSKSATFFAEELFTARFAAFTTSTTAADGLALALALGALALALDALEALALALGALALALDAFTLALGALTLALALDAGAEGAGAFSGIFNDTFTGSDIYTIKRKYRGVPFLREGTPLLWLEN